MQHADHFTRILNEKESLRREKQLENKSEDNTNIIDVNNENSEQSLEKETVETSNDRTNISKSAKSQAEVI